VKKKCTPGEICSDDETLCKFFDAVNELKYDSDPDYDALRKIFQKTAAQKYDWELPSNSRKQGKAPKVVKKPSKKEVEIVKIVKKTKKKTSSKMEIEDENEENKSPVVKRGRSQKKKQCFYRKRRGGRRSGRRNSNFTTKTIQKN